MDNVIEQWASASRYDIQTAKAMLETGRSLYVTFMCQQAVDKLSKAIFVLRKAELPPRTHNLLYFVDVLNFNLNEENKKVLAELNQFYLGSRYPGQMQQLA